MKVFTTPGSFPIKAWVDHVPPIEDASMKQLEAVAKLPFIHKHVAVMPDVHWGNGTSVGSVIATKGAIIPAAVGVDIGCFSGDTKIPLLDGTQVSLKDLSLRADPFWVYSATPDREIVPGRAIALKTRSNANLVKVVISGGDEIICTPDHQFMLVDGTYREAKDLTFNTSLMPLYRRWQTRDGYESCNAGKGTQNLTHKLVWEYYNPATGDGYVIHHVDHNHFNNSPENLVLMTEEAHSSYHREVGHKFDNEDPEFQQLRLEGIRKHMAKPGVLERKIEVGIQNITKYMQENPEHFKESVKDNGKRGKEYLVKFNTTPRTCPDCQVEFPNPGKLMWHRRRDCQPLTEQAGCNHKVISVTALDHTEDVYCLQVEKHHNFALAAGVFVHNCGMCAIRTNYRATDLPDSLAAMRSSIEAAVPHGRTASGGTGDKGAWGSDVPKVVSSLWSNYLQSGFEHIASKHQKVERCNNLNHLGTLGTGNHFIELCLDETDQVWVMLHSGSRGVGGRIGSHFISLAKEEMKRWFCNVPDVNLAYLPEGTEYFSDYINAVGWAQKFAAANRELMLRATIKAVAEHIPGIAPLENEYESAINCHHNYVARERHYGENVLVTRKGAVQAREGTLGIIPGAMGRASFIVRGKGNQESFCSCSHGAGRVMSRGEAKKRITLEDHVRETAGLECRKDADVIDESPQAYKSIQDVMRSQADLVDVVHTLRAILCVKG